VINLLLDTKQDFLSAYMQHRGVPLS